MIGAAIEDALARFDSIRFSQSKGRLPRKFATSRFFQALLLPSSYHSTLPSRSSLRMSHSEKHVTSFQFVVKVGAGCTRFSEAILHRLHVMPDTCQQVT
jgi:hypothetical protein